MASLVKSSAYSHRTGRKNIPAPKLRSIEISPGADGGHSVQHHMDFGDGPYLGQPKSFVFGSTEGPALAAHLSKHLGIKGIKPRNTAQKNVAEAEEEAEGE
jgi:hypothetical protein